MVILSEIKKSFAAFTKHYIQYSIMIISILIAIISTIYFKYNNIEIGMYDRLIYLNIIFNLLLIRIVTNGISLPFSEIIREKDENKIIKNFTISKHYTWKLLLSRIMINGIQSLILSLFGIFAMICMFNVWFSYKNYIFLILYYFISSLFLYGISFIFTGVSILFDLQKMVSIILQLSLIIYFILSPMNHYFNVLMLPHCVQQLMS